MARREFSRKVRRQALARADGRCEASLPSGERCPCALRPGHFVYDHKLPDALGGEPTLENCQVQCDDCDRAKYPHDRAVIDQTRRLRDRHDGIVLSPRQRLRGRPFPKPAPARRASTPLARPLPPRRPVYVPRVSS